MKKYTILLLLILIIASVSFAGGSNEPQEESSVVNVYSHRHYEADTVLYDRFTELTGIEVNLVQASANELIERLQAEGSDSPADVLITVDAGRLFRAKDLGLLQAIESEILEEQIPQHLRDPENSWFGLTKRARIIAYDLENPPGVLPTGFGDLLDPQYQGEILIRSSSNIYNISLMASIIGTFGPEAAETWARGIVSNMAREPKGNDRDQMKALVAGEGSLAVVNTYYLGILLNSADPSEVAVGQRIGIIFPNQNTTGAHINISGAGVTAYAPHKDEAIQFLEFLSSEEAQRVWSEQNYEYPVNPAVEPSELLQSWGSFTEDQLNLSVLGEQSQEASRIFDRVGWR